MPELKIISGTKDEPPMGHNTRIYLNGKEINKHLFINRLWFEVNADGLARYGLILDEPYRNLTPIGRFLRRTNVFFKSLFRKKRFKK